MQTLEPIRIFIAVAEMGSFTRAGDSLGIQKGRVSTAVRKLEEAVGVRTPAPDDAQRAADGGRTGFSCPCARSAC